MMEFLATQGPHFLLSLGIGLIVVGVGIMVIIISIVMWRDLR